MRSTPASEQETRELVLAWVRRKSRTGAPEGITVGTPLFEERHLTSLHVPELLLLLEQLRGAPIDAARLRAGDFRDVGTIVDRFCGGRG